MNLRVGGSNPSGHANAFSGIFSEYRSQRSPGQLRVHRIRLVFENGLLQLHPRGHFEEFQRAMERGLGMVKNESGGHGQGSTVRDVRSFLAACAIRAAAADIALLVQANNALLRKQ
jgi:hypothetical protein